MAFVVTVTVLLIYGNYDRKPVEVDEQEQVYDLPDETPDELEIIPDDVKQNFEFGDVDSHPGFNDSEEEVLDVPAKPIAKKAVKPVAPSAAYENELKTVALTLYGEARNQSVQGKKAIASVIYNRANGDTSKFKRVCLAKRQFSCWNQNDPNSRILHNVNVRRMNNAERKAYRDCILIAKSMYDGKFNSTVSSTHYAGKHAKPYWARRMAIEVVIGMHIFYKS